MNELTLEKGGYKVTIYSDTIAENYTNKIFLITPAQSVANQSLGINDVKIVDLLRVTHQIVIKGYISGSATKTAKEVKDDLINIFKGGGLDGGTTELVYDGDTIRGYIEKLNFVEKSADDPSTTIKDFARYEVAITFVEGVQV